VAVQSGWRGRLSLLTEPGEPLLAASVRLRVGALVAGCAVLVVALGVLFAGQRTAGPFDHAVDAPVVGWFTGHERLARWLVAPGSLYPAIVISAVIVAACLLAGRLNGALLGAAAVPVAEVFSKKVFKPLVDRTLLGGISYPSGHTTAIVALAATLTVLLLGPVRRARARPARVLILTVAYAVVAGVALGLIGLRWHYFTDTVAGAAVGIGTVAGLALILDSRLVRKVLTRARRAADLTS
jgi:membrane-associated phospholipid phosphatase